MQGSSPKQITIRVHVRLEPELEDVAAELNSSQRRALARKFQRWSRQLSVSANMMDNLAQKTQKKPLAPVPRRKLAWN
jgi:hypothetical protein